MLSLRKKSTKKKGSLGFSGGSNSDVGDRVVMFCDDIPSEGSSWDSGWGSQSSGAQGSSSDEPGHSWRSRSFHGREGQSPSSSSRPTKQYSVGEIRHLEAPSVYAQNGGRSVRITELYEVAPPCFVHILDLLAGICIAHLNLWILVMHLIHDIMTERIC